MMVSGTGFFIVRLSFHEKVWVSKILLN
jgi:hypothetical protein